ncbi:MAG: TIGR00159 family protein [Elusimicrobia bacterium RIFOXYC2_FULL_34_12]|nr:MAG: TIGR00159 family protein [Elusimicrobia bacterium RIFOXYC2_FULL_34_12]HAM39392.1 TIGR00159 family protein [Elusimicrobiota bacterium]
MYKEIIFNILDIVALTYILYRLLILIKGTRAVQVLLGVVIIGIITIISIYLKLDTTAWLLKNLWTAGLVILVIIFQPDIRSALAHIGSGKLTHFFMKEEITAIKELVSAVRECSSKKIGMLIVVEQETGLKDVIEKGVKINGEVSHEILVSIFNTRSPLHDGAVIIRGSRIIAAACILPSTENPAISKFLGMRHRAAIGITEVSDALVIIVSEETGIISVSRNGILERNVDADNLGKILINMWKKSEKSFLKKKDKLQ